jgi:hypothetical protein
MKKLLVVTLVAATLSLFVSVPQAQAACTGKHHKHHHHHHHQAA